MSGPRRPLLAAAAVTFGVAAIVLLLVAIGTFIPAVHRATAQLPIVPAVLAVATLAMVVRLIRAR